MTEQPRSRVFRQVAGREVCFDSEGFLWEADDWSDEIAVALARESGIEILSDVQWQVIRFLREYYRYHGRAPMNRDLKGGTGLSLVELEQLFPEGIKHGARRLAGLPNPKSCWY
jgi:dissimilatory sulfite reductase related protein